MRDFFFPFSQLFQEKGVDHSTFLGFLDTCFDMAPSRHSPSSSMLYFQLLHLKVNALRRHLTKSNLIYSYRLL